MHYILRANERAGKAHGSEQQVGTALERVLQNLHPAAGTRSGNRDDVEPAPPPAPPGKPPGNPPAPGAPPAKPPPGKPPVDRRVRWQLLRLDPRSGQAAEPRRALLRPQPQRWCCTKPTDRPSPPSTPTAFPPAAGPRDRGHRQWETGKRSLRTPWPRTVVQFRQTSRSRTWLGRQRPRRWRRACTLPRPAISR